MNRPSSSQTEVLSSSSLCVSSDAPADPPYLEISGAWTKAGVASCVHVKGRNRENFLLDCGVAEAETFSAQWVFVSHGHLDHAGACISHARVKALNSSPSTYVIPKQIEEAFRMAKRGLELMDDREIPMNIVTVQAGDEVSLSPSLCVRVFATEHRVPSQGYMFFSRTRGTLKPEFVGLSGAEIKALKQEGVEILTPARESLELVYTGDTTFEGLLRSPQRDLLFSARTLVMELTYLDGDRAKAAQWKHVHLEDVAEHAALFRNAHVVFVHISQKYTYSKAIELVRSRLPAELLQRVSLSLKSFGAEEALTSLSPARLWERQRETVAGWGWSNVAQSSSSHKGPYRGQGRGQGQGRGRSNDRGRGRGGSSKKFKA